MRFLSNYYAFRLLKFRGCEKIDPLSILIIFRVILIKKNADDCTSHRHFFDIDS